MMAVNALAGEKKQSVPMATLESHVGEMDEVETKILVDPAQRIINQVTVEDAKAADRLFDDLMGDAVVPRKKFIKDHSDEARYHI